MARRRCPLFDETIGITPQTSLTIDWLHCLSLGVFKVWAMHCYLSLLDNNVFNVLGSREDVRTRSAIRLRTLLFAWYSSEERAGRSHSRVQDLTESMLGSRSTDILGLHGSETNGFVRFLVGIILPE